MSEEDGEDPKITLPRPEQILETLVPKDARRAQRQFQKKISEQSPDAQAKYEHLKGLRDHYSHKRKWSWFLMGLMFLMIAFQSFLLWKVGTGVWDFTQYSWLLPALLIQNLGQVIGLAFVVVRSLFR